MQMPWLVLCYLLCCHAFSWVEPQRLSNTQVESPEVEAYFTETNWNDTKGYFIGRVVPLDNEMLFNASNCSSVPCIAVTDLAIGHLPGTFVALARSRGFYAILVESYMATIGYNNYIIEHVAEEDKIPTFEIPTPIYTSLIARLNTSETVILNLTRGDINPWRVAFESGGMVVWQVLLATSAGGCVALSLVRFVQYGEKRKQFSLSTFGVSVVLICNMVSLSYFLTDPLGSRRYINHVANCIWMTLPWSFSLVHTVSVSIFWTSLVEKSWKRDPSFLTARERLLLVFIVFLFFGQDVTLSALRGSHLGPLTLLWLITGIFYSVVTLLLVGWYFQKGIHILKMVRSQAGSAPSPQTNPAEKITRLLLASAFGSILFVVLLPILTTITFYEPTIYITVFFFIYASLQWCSWMQLLTLAPTPVVSAS